MSTSKATREERQAEVDEDRYDDYEEDDYADDGYSDGDVTTAAAAAQAALGQLSSLIGKQAEGVVAVEPDEDGWLVSVEVVEDRRIPSSADVLAIYQAVIDTDGGLNSYRRTSRYSRGQGDQGGGR
jgi:Gas vesicle synthesis protein GvpO